MYRLTHTLLESWRRATDPESDEDDFASFLNLLERKKTPKTPAMKTGIAFETAINRYVSSQTVDIEDERMLKAVTQFGNRLRGAQLQVRAELPVEIEKIPFLLVGVADALYAGIISDIKRPTRYEYGKYSLSTQHPMYMELFPEATRFDYLIFDGAYCYREQYRRGDFAPIHDTIRAFVRYLNDADLMEVYQKYWEEK